MDVITTTYSRFGVQLKKTGREEYHGGCPRCGGTKRFIVWEQGNYWCRECDFKGWLQEREKTWKPDSEKILAFQKEIERRRDEEQKRLVDWQNGFNAGYMIGRWHDTMARQNREYWLAQGIEEQNIDRYILGFCPKKKVRLGESTVSVPAYTIPILDPYSGKLANIQYRLVDPPNGAGRYRQEYNIPPAAFYANTNLDGDVVIVEGAKKAIVVSQLVQEKMQVVGLPGISPSDNILEKLKVFRRKWLIPDPDVKSEQIERFRVALGMIGVVTLPDKIDDCVIRYGLNRPLFRKELMFARR